MKFIYLLVTVILTVVLISITFVKGEITEIEEIQDIDEIFEVNDECSGIKCGRVDRLRCLTAHRPVARYLDRKFSTRLCCPICLIPSYSFCNHTTTSNDDPYLKYLTGNVYICHEGQKECNLKTKKCEVLPQYR